MIQGITAYQQPVAPRADFLPTPVRSLPLIPETYRLTASSAGTLITIREAELELPASSENPAVQEARGFQLEILS